MLVWIAVAIACGYAATRIFAGYPRPAQPHRVLARREVAFIASVAEAMYPPGGAIEASGLDADVPGYVDRLMVASHTRTRVLLRLLFFLVEHATLIFPAPGRDGRRRFSSLDFDRRVAVLDAWANSGMFARRLVFTSLRALVTMGFFAHPPVLRELGVAPLAIEVAVCEADLLFPPIGGRPEVIPYTRDDLRASSGIPLDLDAPLHPDYAGDAT
jgi:hypothetical protein